MSAHEIAFTACTCAYNALAGKVQRMQHCQGKATHLLLMDAPPPLFVVTTLLQIHKCAT